MNRSQKIILVAGLIFLLIMSLIAWDFSRQTKFREFKKKEATENSATSSISSKSAYLAVNKPLSSSSIFSTI